MTPRQKTKIERRAWHDNIALAQKERNAEIVQGVIFHPWVTRTEEMARLQAIKEILQSEPCS